MTESEICSLVEGNEARAYVALVESASSGVQAQCDLSVRRVGGAYAFVAGGVRDSLLLNRVIGLGVWQSSTQAHVEELDDLYRAHGVETYAAEVAPVGVTGLSLQALQEMGFVPFKQTTMMYRDTAIPLTAVSSLVAREVNEAFADDFAGTCCSMFKFSDPFPDLLRNSFRRPDFKHWMAFDDDRPVAAAMTVEFEEGTAWIGWVCTLPSHRGRGAQTSLAAAQLRGCIARGVNCVTLEAATGTKKRPSQSLRNYARLGWKAAYDRLILLKRV